MLEHGFVRVAAAVPIVKVADCTFNLRNVAGLMERAESDGVHVLVFPELCLTGYTCADLFQQKILQDAALDALKSLSKTMKFSGLAVVGLPLVVNDQLFNCAAVLHGRRILGVIPKSFLPNYKEFYEARWFAPAATARAKSIIIDEQEVPFGADLLFAADDVPGLIVGVEICEDLWLPNPPSSYQCLAGASVLLNLSASNEVIGKVGYRRQLVVNQSGRCIAGYVYSSCGVHESTTDVVFGGHCLIAENGTLLTETPRFQRDDTVLVSDIDLDRLRMDRLRMNSFGEAQRQALPAPAYRMNAFTLSRKAGGLWQGATALPAEKHTLRREVDAHPFVPRQSAQLRERCEEIFHTQVAGLAKRLEHIGSSNVAIGISGGLDSTLALLVTCKTLDALNAPRSKIRGLTMPGFGTTARTKENAVALMRQLGVAAADVDIRQLCLDEMRSLGHKPFGLDLTGIDVRGLTDQLRQLPAERRHDLVFENVQARMRMNLLMNAGFVIGTGDLSELALGWCTYNGDHMSMYNPNVSIPKTLVKFLVRWAAENEFAGDARKTLLDIVATVISPELLPADADGKIVQETESALGPYELHDFFLFHFLRYGATPKKILFLAEQATFDRAYPPEEIRTCLRTFLQRFFANQFKRSCIPDGPKVGSIAISPRGDWRMPSDAEGAAWVREME